MQVVYRVEVILDGRVYRWYTRSPEDAARLLGQVTVLFPDATPLGVEPVQRYRPGAVAVVRNLVV